MAERLYVSTKNETVRMFESDFMEFFSRVHPAIPVVIYVPVVVCMLYISIWHHQLSIVSVMAYGTPRFRVMVEPSVAVLAAIGACWLWDRYVVRPAPSTAEPSATLRPRHARRFSISRSRARGSAAASTAASSS